jgi:hypothetical protein
MIINKKRLYARTVAIVLILILGFVMSRIGKQHVIYLDNKTVTVQGEEFMAFNELSIQIDKQEAVDSYKRERGQAAVVGKNHTITVSYTDANWNEVVVERDFEIPHSENAIIFSLPVFLSRPDDVNYYLTPFVLQMVN